MAIRKAFARAGLSLIVLSYGTTSQAKDPYTYSAVTKEDELILLRANELISDQSSWNRFDDRKCNDDETLERRSLFCALRKATIEVLGSYNHRRAAIQVVRSVIEAATPGQIFNHPLMEYNNAATTRFLEIKQMLMLSIKRVRAEQQ